MGTITWHWWRNKGKVEDLSFICFYEDTGTGQHVPRNLCVDLQPNCTDDVKKSKYSKIYHPEFLSGGKEDASNNFARGDYTIGKGMIN